MKNTQFYRSKYLAFLLGFIMAAMTLTLSLTGCAPATAGSAAIAATETPAPSVEPDDRAAGAPLRIVTTIFPLYDWTRSLLGENPNGAQLTLLLDDGVDLHSYQPTAEDMHAVAECDLFIYVGGESDGWVEDALTEATNPDMQVIDLLEVLGDSVKEEELVEGMEAEEEEEAQDGEEEAPEYDEHVWLSLKHAQTICRSIGAALAQLDAANAGTYQAALTDYLAQLAALDADYQAAVDSAAGKTLLFGDRFPFCYLVEDYGLDYYAAFVGCSAETEASFETVAFLAGKVDELNLHTVLTIEHSDERIARTIIENTQTKDQQILALDSMQSTTAADLAAGTSYLSVMESNLDVLQKALG